MKGRITMNENIIEYFTNNDRSVLEWVSFGIDIALAAVVVIGLLILLAKHIKKSAFIPGLITYIVLFVVAYLLDLKLIKIYLYG